MCMCGHVCWYFISVLLKTFIKLVKAICATNVNREALCVTNLNGETKYLYDEKRCQKNRQFCFHFEVRKTTSKKCDDCLTSKLGLISFPCSVNHFA